MGAIGGPRAHGRQTDDWNGAELLHDIAITNIVWCIAYKRRVGGEAYLEQ